MASCTPYLLVLLNSPLTVSNSGTNGVKPYNILILFFSMAYMSITLDATGLLRAAAHWVSNISGKSTTRLYINFYLMATALSAILGNDAVILSGTLFLLYYAEATGVRVLCMFLFDFTELFNSLIACRCS